MAAPTSILHVSGIDATGKFAGSGSDPAEFVDGRRRLLEIHNPSTTDTLRVFFVSSATATAPPVANNHIEIGPGMGRVWSGEETPSDRVYLRCVTATITAKVVTQTRSD